MPLGQRVLTIAQRDINLVLDNAILYNAPDTMFTRIAKRITANSRPLLDELGSIPVWSSFKPPEGDDGKNAVAVAVADTDAAGDLEPSQVLLHSLINPDEDSSDLLSKLFRFELEKPRAPTPPLAPPKQRMYMSAAERKQRWTEREVQAKERVQSRTSRAAAAATQAFEEEAGIAETPPVTAGSSSRTARSRHAKLEEDDSAETSRYGNKVGVAGYETFAILNDRQRRAQEKAMDLVTENVDSQDLFKRFNVGWVLPEGSKRRRAERPPEVSQPAKRNFLGSNEGDYQS